jgi:ABC-type multidrug transport system fused ATPase/permease subunit
MSPALKPPKVQIPVRQYFGLLEEYLKPQRASVILMAVCLLLSVGLQLFNPQIVRFFMDTAQSGGAQSDLVKAAAVFIGASFFQQVLNVGATYFSTRVGWTATNALRANLAEHCLKLDLSVHKACTPGELIERIARHQLERPETWTTIEAPTDVQTALEHTRTRVVILDCLSLLVSNLMFENFLNPKSSNECTTCSRFEIDCGQQRSWFWNRARIPTWTAFSGCARTDKPKGCCCLE